MSEAIQRTDLPFPLIARGKVRDVYDVGGDRLLIVATDRISAYDVVLPRAIPDTPPVTTATFPVKRPIRNSYPTGDMFNLSRKTKSRRPFAAPARRPRFWRPRPVADRASGDRSTSKVARARRAYNRPAGRSLRLPG